jgi:hypothetical protein
MLREADGRWIQAIEAYIPKSRYNIHLSKFSKAGNTKGSDPEKIYP